MARKKQQRHPLLEAMVMLALLVAMLLVYVAPPLILLAWVFTEMRVRTGKVTEFCSSDLITEKEAADLNELNRDWAIVAGVVQELYDRGKASGLQYRSDDLFDARNPFGRELNRQIVAARDEQSIIEQVREDILQRVAGRLALLTGRYAHRAAARAAVIVWALIYLGLVVFKPDWDALSRAALASVAALSTAAFVSRTRASQLREKLAPA